jgi:glyoxylase-like metal-dependent hydrolase (beta-lactamase superfamily II)
VTHLHPDHCEFFDLFPNAALVVQKQGFTDALPSVRPRVMAALARRWPQSLRLVSAPEEILVPGIRCVHLGCHSPCSQAVVVDTERGRAVFAGDVAYLYANLESDRPIGGVPPPAWATAAATIRRYADILIPGHDPEVLERWPGGWIPACC